MKRSAISIPRRLRLLVGALLLLLVAFAVQRIWLDEETRERSLAGASLSQLEKRAARSPADPLLFYYLARRRLDVGNTGGAMEALGTALTLNPRFGRARATLGSLLLSVGDTDEAVLQLRQAVQEDPANVDAYLALALVYGNFEAWHRQAAAAEAATRIDPKNPDAWILRGEAAYWLRDFGRAAQFYERAAALAPDRPRPRALAARAHLSLTGLDRAEQHARDAVRVGPKDPLAHTVLAEVLLRRGRARLPEVVQLLERAISLGESTGEAYMGLGLAYEGQGRHSEAEQQFRLALRANRALNQARYGLMQVLRVEGKRAEARQVEAEFRAWDRFNQQRMAQHDRVALRPSDPTGWFALARLYVAMQLWPTAKRLTESGLRRDPAHPEGRRLLAEIERHAP